MFVRSLLAISLIFWSTIRSSSADSAQPSSATPLPGQPNTLTPSELTVLNYGKDNKACVAWSDGCVSCRRADGEQSHCSNIGIACQPKEISCSESK